jgi:alanine racemase
MTVRLSVRRAAWLDHVHASVAAYGTDGRQAALVPVVKGNGYGFGRSVLHQVVRDLVATTSVSPIVCVGTVHELHDVPNALHPVVLTPVLAAPIDHRPILTVGTPAHVDLLGGWRGRVVVKLASSMRRYGASPAELPALLAAVEHAGLTIEAFGLHLPLAGTDTERRAEVEAWLPHIPASVPLWLSHLTATTFQDLQAAQSDRTFRVRLGTALWHGIPRADFIRLSADVLDTRPVRAGDVAGYRHSVVPHDGTLVAIGGGTANGIAALDHQDPTLRSPFHFARRRLPLLEPPHMHTSMLVVPAGAPCPTLGERVDLQRPLTATLVDEVEWQ